MLNLILGSHIAQKIFLYLYHHGEGYPSGIARDMNLSQGAVQKQFQRFEEAGIVISKLQGKTRVYRFNMKNGGIVKPFREMVRVVYESIPAREKESLFPVRRRPRRAGKPVIGRKG